MAPDQNAWLDETRTGPPDGTCGEGYSEGQVVPDVRLPDQNGDTVSLWQFYGDVILLDVCTIWCIPCEQLGATAEATYQDRKDEGFMYFTVVQEDFYGAPPDQADLQSWVDGNGLTTPVLGDTSDPRVTADAILGGALPGVLVIDRDLRVIQRVNPTDTATVDKDVDAAL